MPACTHTPNAPPPQTLHTHMLSLPRLAGAWDDSKHQKRSLGLLMQAYYAWREETLTQKDIRKREAKAMAWSDSVSESVGEGGRGGLHAVCVCVWGGGVKAHVRGLTHTHTTLVQYRRKRNVLRAWFQVTSRIIRNKMEDRCVCVYVCACVCLCVYAHASGVPIDLAHHL